VVAPSCAGSHAGGDHAPGYRDRSGLPVPAAREAILGGAALEEAAGGQDRRQGKCCDRAGEAAAALKARHERFEPSTPSGGRAERKLDHVLRKHPELHMKLQRLDASNGNCLSASVERMQGDLEALGERSEVEGEDAFTLENPWLLKAALAGGALQGRLGSMVAYQGEFRFERTRAGWRRIFKRALTPEGGRLMEVSGVGEVFLAHLAKQIYRVRLDDEEVTCNSRNVLAFESGIEWDIRRVRRGLAGKVAGGLFNTHLSGSGWVALVSEGQPVLLRPSEAPTFADPQAAIAWSGSLETTFKSGFQARTFIGLGSGESVQMGFQGEGWVLVQPSEGHQAGGSSGGGAGGLLDLLPFG
jgi:uncharacterized protein (AIM24 family)